MASIDLGRMTDDERLVAFRRVAEQGKLATLAPLLPLMFNLKGSPYSLADHLPFEPIFRNRKAESSTFKCGRQVSKSTSLASDGLVFAAAQPHTTTLFIAPLFEQIRRFSVNYVGDFLKHSPVASLWLNAQSSNNVLQRDFRNGSKLIFSFASLSADRVRGVNADRCNFDESVCKHTLVDVLDDSTAVRREIHRLVPGDLVLSFDHDGKLLWSPVRTVSHHGHRQCFKLTTAGGRHVTATSDSFLATDRGWRRVAQIVDAYAGRDARGEIRQAAADGVADAQPVADGAGDDAGRRFDGPSGEVREVPKQPRLAAGYVQLDEVHRLGRVRLVASVEAEERRLRGVLERVRDGVAPGVRLLVRPDLSGLQAGAGAGQPEGLHRQGPWLPELRSRDGSQRHLGVDEIVSIECVGVVEVYDIEVEGTHTFCPGGIASSNCQDLDHDHVPIIQETMSYSKWGISQFTGTPKSADNAMEMYWSRSSMAEWIIPCHDCRSPTHRHGITWNIPSAGRHILAMIGPMRDDISDANPAVVCHRCRRPINPRQGHWEHGRPELRWTQAGYHVPQIIMPEHYGKPDKWRKLLAKQQNMAPNLFHNEVLGESYDVGSKLVTIGDLRAAACLGFPNRPDDPDERMTRRLSQYATTVLGIDWGGGRRVAGKEETSYTVMALMGLTGDNRIDVLWGKRLMTPHDHLGEADQVRKAVARFKPTLLAHDYTGAGSLRETFLIQAGLPLEKIVPVAYCGSARRGIMTHIPASDVHPRDHFQMDKTRSLLYTTSALKVGRIRTFDYDNFGDQDPGLLHDFLALIDEKSETGIGEVYKVVRQPGFTDDFAHAVNIGANCLWHANGYPDFAADYRGGGEAAA